MRKTQPTIATLILLGSITLAQESQKPRGDIKTSEAAINKPAVDNKPPRTKARIEFRWVEREHKDGITDPKKHKTICPSCPANHDGFAHKKPVGAAQHIVGFKRGAKKWNRQTIELTLNNKGVQAMAQAVERVDTFSLGVYVDGVFTGVLSREDAVKKTLVVQSPTANDVTRLYLADKGTKLEQPKLIARFRFDDDLKDSSGKDAKVIAKKPAFKDGSLYVNGKQKKGILFEGKPSYQIKTPQMDPQRFTVAVRFNAYRLKDPEYHTILCGGGERPWFHLANSSEGRLQVILNGSAKHPTSLKLKTRNWYDVVCQFDLNAGVLLLHVNGEKLDSIRLPDDGLKINGDDDKAWTFSTMRGPGSVFHGLIDEFAVYDNAFWPGSLPRDIFTKPVDKQQK